MLDVVRLALEEHPSVRAERCAGSAQLRSFLGAGRPDLLIVDTALPATEVEAALGEILAEDPPPALVFLGEPGEALRDLPAGATVVPRPVSAPALARALAPLVGSGGGGREASPFSLTDFLQLAALGQHSVRFDVVLEDGTRGGVDVVGGTIRHSECGSRVGVDALRILLSRPSASLEVRSLTAPERGAELDLPVTHALLDLAVRHDGRVLVGDSGEYDTVLHDPGAEDGDGFDEVFAAGIEASLEGDYGRAVGLFSRALELRPGEPRALHNLRRAEQLAGGGDHRTEPGDGGE